MAFICGALDNQPNGRTGLNNLIKCAPGTTTVSSQLDPNIKCEQVIARDLHSDTTSIYWASTSFVLCSAIVQPIFTSLCILGRKTSILIALALFAIGSIVCAVALNTATLIGGRSIQGVGGGGLLALTYIVMVDLFHLEQQTRVYGAVSLMWLVGSIAGPVTGGAFAYYVSWVRVIVFILSGTTTNVT